MKIAPKQGGTMLGTIARLLLVRVLGRRLIPILTVVEIAQLLRRRRDEYRRTPAPSAGRGPKAVGPASRRPSVRRS